jgi:hypothetical protein
LWWRGRQGCPTRGISRRDTVRARNGAVLRGKGETRELGIVRGPVARAADTGGSTHAGLRRVSHHTAARTTGSTRESLRTGGIVHGGTAEKAGRGEAHRLLHAQVALSNLALELLAADVLALSERDIERLSTDHLVIHLRHSLGSLIGGRIADETKALRGSLVVAHDLAAGDRAKGLELGTELLVIDVVLEILDVQVDALVLALFLGTSLLVRAAQLLVALSLFLSARDVESLAVQFKLVELFDSLLSIVVVLVVDESEALVLALLVASEHDRGNGAVFGHEVTKCFFGDVLGNILDKEIRELSLHLIDLGLTLLDKSSWSCQ